LPQLIVVAPFDRVPTALTIDAVVAVIVCFRVNG
jgi:hypothetical protein